VILSTFPFYYEAKFILLLWLMFREGADDVYRRLRMFILSWGGVGKLIHRQRQAAEAMELAQVDTWIVDEALQAHAKRKGTEVGARRKTLELLDDEGNAIPKANATSLPKPPPESPSFSLDSDGANWEEEVEDKSKGVRLSFSFKTPPPPIVAPGSGSREERETIGVSERLIIVSEFLLSEPGSSALSRAGLDSPARGLLLERAAARLSFQPRFLRAEVVGTPHEKLGPMAELPSMDSNGKSDAYVVCRVRSPDGKAYPQGKSIVTRTVYRTVRPQWREMLEIPLVGGTIEVDGKYRSPPDLAGSELVLEVYDADVGVWGWLVIIARFLGFCLGGVVLAAYIAGWDDDVVELAPWVSTAVPALATLLTGVYAIAFVVARLWRGDDEMVGEASVPIKMLMDQMRHTVNVKLQPPRQTSTSPDIKAAHAAGGSGVAESSTYVKEEAPRDAPATPTKLKKMTTVQRIQFKKNSVGELGALKLRLLLSER
jgi:hypothetical protein